jgi:hypothetical protein
MEAGSFELTGVGALPNVTVAFPGEKWSNRKASGAPGIVPGQAVVPTTSAGGLFMRPANAGDAITQLAIALRPIDVPDVNTGPGSLGPNEIRNTKIAQGEYVLAYYSGAFHLTLVDPRRTYTPDMLIGWDADGEVPKGKEGVGSWAPNANADIDSVFEVMEVREVGDDGEVILTVRSLRGQF